MPLEDKGIGIFGGENDVMGILFCRMGIFYRSFCKHNFESKPNITQMVNVLLKNFF